MEESSVSPRARGIRRQFCGREGWEWVLSGFFFGFGAGGGGGGLGWLDYWGGCVAGEVRLVCEAAGCSRF